MGNVKGNRYWEARLPKDFRRPPSGNPNPELAAFIRGKYVDRLYAATDAPPPTIDNWEGHPYVGATSSADEPSPASGSSGTSAAALPPAAVMRISGMGAKPASSPALAHDLLGGFDEIAAGSSTTPTAPNASRLSTATSPDDPFGAFVSAPPPQAATPPLPARNSHEWTDFHAAPSPGPLGGSQPVQTVSQLFPHGLPNGSSSHHRSASISEGIDLLTSASASAPFAAGADLSLNRLQSNSHQHHNSAGTAMGTAAVHNGNHVPHQHPHQQHQHRADSHNAASSSGAQQQHGKPHHAGNHHKNTVTDPFAAMGDDLLAGLTIHQVMDVLPSSTSTGGAAGPGTTPLPPSSSAAGLANTSTSTSNSAAGGGGGDPFPYSPSRGRIGSSTVDHSLPAPGAGHKRHPSNAKSPDEIIKLFDSVPSTGGPALGAAGSGGLGGASSGVLAPATASTSSTTDLFDGPFSDYLGPPQPAVAPGPVSKPAPAGPYGVAALMQQQQAVLGSPAVNGATADLI